MVFEICSACKQKGIQADYDSLLLMKTEDEINLCAMCEQRIPPDSTSFSINVKVRRITGGVYFVLPLTSEYLNNLDCVNKLLTLQIYKNEVQQ